MKTSPHQELDGMITGYWISQSIYVVAKLGIADHLSDGPKSVDELARETSSDPESLYRLLRALASRGIFAEGAPREFSLTQLAEPLQSDIPGSKRALSLMSGDEQYLAWSKLEHTIRTGETAFDQVFGKPIFEYLGDHPDKAKIFDAAMVGIHGREAELIVKAYDFSKIGTLADIGGGNGSLITSVLQANPNMQGILFDLPHTVERATAPIAAAGIADRCQLVGGDFFRAVPSGADAYMMRHIIHDWDDEKSLTILRCCHQAMSADSKLVIIESVIPPGNEPFGGKFLDLVMMLIPGGKERTEDQYRSLLNDAGFDLTQVISTESEISILEAAKK